MSQLKVFADQNPETALLDTREGAQIKAELDRVGVLFERWETPGEIADDATQEEILALYDADIERLKAEGGYQTVDVLHMVATHPEKDAMRQKFLNEHRHHENEVRFFVKGQGLFCLHIDDQVYQVLCTQGDLISVPANTPHWFDMGPAPEFTALRFFDNVEGWVPHWTESDIAGRFDRLDQL
ncbi:MULTISPECIES: acireductone dioxygenase [unclassified Halomonas]|uniref:1,2-dihydroxy-3-keto-5-methylthiopentene dioxygenase n=1 Tax=unclassified Halomonas TaxID=2609666 RepID=UPI00209C8AFF|nr:MULTISPECIES: cupin domain-containing protein [unclassified Halomonas]MCP1313468.1 cupin domain-containing protein [Halomonas sp. 707D7]MCP1325841.1 cupin domain-containing protein [Halomonas sp. 707D4]